MQKQILNAAGLWISCEGLRLESIGCYCLNVLERLIFVPLNSEATMANFSLKYGAQLSAHSTKFTEPLQVCMIVNIFCKMHKTDLQYLWENICLNFWSICSVVLVFCTQYCFWKWQNWQQDWTEVKRHNHKSVCFPSTTDSAMDLSIHSTERLLISHGRTHRF